MNSNNQVRSDGGTLDEIIPDQGGILRPGIQILRKQLEGNTLLQKQLKVINLEFEKIENATLELMDQIARVIEMIERTAEHIQSQDEIIRKEDHGNEQH